MAQNSVKLIPLTSFNTTGLTTAYQVINSTGLPAACFLVRIINNSNQDITISVDGVTDHEFVPKNSYFEINGENNAQPNAMFALFKVGMKFYVKGAGAGTGLIYLAGYYV